MNLASLLGSTPPAPGADTSRGSSADEPTHLVRILCLGDSLTAGYGLNPDEAYPARLEELLKADGIAVEVRNAGLSGDTTAGGARRISWVLRAPADIVLVALGGNDVLRGFPAEETEKNLRAILATIHEQAPQAEVILAGMQAPPNMGDAYARDFAAAFKRVATSTKVTFVPFLLEGVAGDPALNQADGIHPNALGQQRIAERLKPVFASLLPPSAE